MAQGWTNHLYAGRITAESAGTAPKGIDPRAVAVMAESNIDLSGNQSKHIDDVDATFDLVVTVCDQASEACPVMPGARRVIHRGFDDPPRLAQAASSQAEALEHYRRVRDEIHHFVAHELPTQLGIEQASVKTTNQAGA